MRALARAQSLIRMLSFSLSLSLLIKDCCFSVSQTNTLLMKDCFSVRDKDAFNEGLLFWGQADKDAFNEGLFFRQTKALLMKDCCCSVRRFLMKDCLISVRQGRF